MLEKDEELEKYSLGYTPDNSLYRLFSSQSSRLDRCYRSKIISRIIRHWLGGLGIWHGIGYVANSHVPKGWWCSQREIVCKHNPLG